MDEPMDDRTRRLGRSGLQVSALGLGCWPIGGAMAAGDQQLGYTGVDDAESLRALAGAVDAGITLFDTADAYGAGHSERLLGRALAGHPEVLVATKFGNTIDEDARQLTGRDSSPAHVRAALHASLRRLRRDRVDLYQLHTPDVGDERAAERPARRAARAPPRRRRARPRRQDRPLRRAVLTVPGAGAPRPPRDRPETGTASTTAETLDPIAEAVREVASGGMLGCVNVTSSWIDSDAPARDAPARDAPARDALAPAQGPAR